MVDDDPDILEITQEALDDARYEVTSVASLPASLTLLEERLYHLVLTDLFYRQGQSPLDSIDHLLAQAAPTPVGVMTAWQVSGDAAQQAGYACLLHKPFELETLLRAVQDGLRPRLTGKQQQVQVVQAFFVALNDRDWKRIARLCTPDFTMSPFAAPAVSLPHPRGGLFVLREALERRSLALPGYTIEDTCIYNRPLGVAVRYLGRWQSSDGIVHRVAGSMHLHFQGDRIARIKAAF